MNRVVVTSTHRFKLLPRFKWVDWGTKRFLTIRWLGILIQVTA